MGLHDDVEMATVSSEAFKVPAKKEFSIPLKTNIPSNKIAFKRTSSPVTNIGYNIIQKIHEDFIGNLWVGTNAGLDIHVPIKNKFSSITPSIANPKSLSDPIIKAILKDSKGVLWLASWEGIFKLHNKAF